MFKLKKDYNELKWNDLFGMMDKFSIHHRRGKVVCLIDASTLTRPDGVDSHQDRSIQELQQLLV